MRPPLLLVLLLPSALPLRCAFDDAGGYALTTSGGARIEGLPVAVATKDGWVSASAGGAHRLTLGRIVSNASGADPGLGTYTGQAAHWSSKAGGAFVTGCRSYAGGRTLVLWYSFPAGATFSASAPPAGLCTQFPAVEQASLRRAGFSQALSWEHDTMQPANRFTLGPSGGPTVYAAPGFSSVLVVSPLDWFMTSSTSNATHDHNETAIAAWGTAATVRSVPPGFVHRIVLHEGWGLTQTIHEYGQMMQAVAAAGSGFASTSKVPDVTLRRLGYSTDNGAMYCYCKQHCDTTLLAVKDAWDRDSIPMAYLTFEGSWFENNWSAMWCVSELQPNSALDMDVPSFVRRLQAPIHGYLPYFCNDSSLFGHGAGVWPSLSSSPGYSPPAFGRCNLAHPLPFDFQIVKPDSAREFFAWLFDHGFGGNGTHSVRPGAGLAAFESDFCE
jgi:hypothetical protein